MMTAIAAAPFDGQGEPLSCHVMGVELWCTAANLEVCKRSSEWVLQMGPIARDARMVIGNGKRLAPDGASLVLTGLRGNSLPDAHGCVYPELVSFSHF